MSTPSFGIIPVGGHTEGEGASTGASPAPANGNAERAVAALVPVPSFEEVYETHFAFVWRSIRRLGIPISAVDDAVQDVFIVVHRRLPEFEARASVRTWLFAILVRVVRDYRRAYRRKDMPVFAAGEPSDPDEVGTGVLHDPQEIAAHNEASRHLHLLLDRLDDDKREVFVLAELEQMAVPEIAEALGINLNTAYSRLRTARQDFEQGVARLRARDGWRLR